MDIVGWDIYFNISNILIAFNHSTCTYETKFKPFYSYWFVYSCVKKLFMFLPIIL